jgi:hypothetical protein
MNAYDSTVVESVEEWIDANEVTGYRATGMQDEPVQDADSHPEVEWSPEEEEAHYRQWCRRESERVARQLDDVAAEIVREAAMSRKAG